MLFTAKFSGIRNFRNFTVCLAVHRTVMEILLRIVIVDDISL